MEYRTMTESSIVKDIEGSSGDLISDIVPAIL
jgi:hypothetical protein